MKFNKRPSQLAIILSAHLSLFSAAAVADIVLTDSSMHIPHLIVGDEVYAFNLDSVDAGNTKFQINLSTVADVTKSVNLDSIADAVFDGSAIIISRLQVDETIYSVKLNLIDAKDFFFEVDAGAVEIVGSKSSDDSIDEYYGTKMPFFCGSASAELQIV